MKQWMLGLCTAAIFALVSTACGSLTPDSLAFVEETERPGQTVIRLATFTNVGIAGAIEQWEREHPTATVIVDLRAFDDHHSTMLEPRADTGTPDVVAFDVVYSANFRERTDLLRDLRAFGATELEDDMLPWRWAQGVADGGAVVAMPIDAGGVALAYRTDLVGPDLAESIETMESWCDLLTVGDAYSDLTAKPFLPRASDIFDAVLNQSELRYADGDGEPIHETNPALHRAWDMAIRSLGEKPQFEDPCPAAEGIDRFSANLVRGSEEWTDALRSGDIAGVIASAETLGDLQTTVPETAGRWRVVPIPDGGSGNASGLSLGVHAESSHADLAYDLVAFLAEPSTQQRVFEDLGRFPAAQSLFGEDRLVDYWRPFYGDSPIGSIYIASVTDYVPAPDGTDLRLVQRELRGAVSRVESGNQTPQEAWDEAIWRILRVLD